MNFLIRKATVSDAQCILELTIDGINTWGSEILPNLKPWLDMVSSINDMRTRLSNPENNFYVAEHEGSIVGTIYLTTDASETAHMGGLYCSLKKCGLGTTLLRHAMDEAISLGCSLMKCEIYEGNVPSISLMKKYGATYSLDEYWAGVRYLTYQFELEEAYVAA